MAQPSGRRLFSRKEFEALKRQPKAVVLGALEQFVKRPAGKPKSGKEPLSPAERAKRYRERKKGQSL